MKVSVVFPVPAERRSQWLRAFPTGSDTNFPPELFG